MPKNVSNKFCELVQKKYQKVPRPKVATSFMQSQTIWQQLSNKSDDQAIRQEVRAYLSITLMHQNQIWVMDLKSDSEEDQEILHHLTTRGRCNDQMCIFG